MACGGGGEGDVFTGAVIFSEAGVAAGDAACDCGDLTVRCGGSDEQCWISDAALPEIEDMGAACALCGDVLGLPGDAASPGVGGTEATSGSGDVSSAEELGDCSMTIKVNSGHTWNKKKPRDTGSLRRVSQ